MIVKLTCKNCKISSAVKRYIDQHLKKIDQSLPDIEDDLVVFRLILRKNIDKYHPPKSRHPNYKNYGDTKPALAFYEGSMTFRLDKNPLYVHFKGQTIEECVDRGFKLIFKELKKYKDSHFVSQSRYPHRESIRGRYV